ncbi:TetR/AcrR family transcriptional regulator [Gordonia otitidis]|uniref:TetR/AcrR family transcriptional regulator n=1 Tax=Gordonia otitidis TaxID=249058 RepID=UPI001D14A35D|nr:TetR/AcrR family transcriptional regulator [Gordonia otitidis]UEA57776.1 TetR/AcrR family transcriptional regulator [Gordonia otitidis]
MAPSDTAGGTIDLRTEVVAASIRLFSENGYESTTVDQIAAAAGVSRRTLFRQFRSKEDMIFADHEVLLAAVAEQLADSGDSDPWAAVCTAAELVFVHFLTSRELAVRRMEVVSKVSALRERELVTTYRYQRVFEEHLRARLTDESPVHIVAFAAAITSAHNYLLRSMIRGDADATLERLRRDLARIRLALGATRRPEVAVITYPAGMSADEISRAVADQLDEDRAARRH